MAHCWIKTLEAWKFYCCQKNLLQAILKNCGSSLRRGLRNHSLMSFILALGYCSIAPEPMKTIAVVRAILWNLLNFRDTYHLRLAIQTRRIADESEILIRMYLPLPRYETSRYGMLRRILSTLFEYSQLRSRNVQMGEEIQLHRQDDYGCSLRTRSLCLGTGFVCPRVPIPRSFAM